MYANVNGVQLFYTVKGSGRPMILLHSNGMNHRIFSRIMAPLSKQYTAYAIDTRDHGRSSKVKNLFYRDMADDVIAFIRAFHLKNVTLYGHSDGGIIGLLVASKVPELIETLIVSGANTSPGGIKKIWLGLYKLMYSITKDNKTKLMLEQPDISDEELARITAKTLVLAGKFDLIKEEHTKHIAKSIKNSTLRILKWESHGSYIVFRKKLLPIFKSFAK